MSHGGCSWAAGRMVAVQAAVTAALGVRWSLGRKEEFATSWEATGCSLEELWEADGELSEQGYMEKLKKGAGHLQCRTDAKLTEVMKKETFAGAYRDRCRKLLRLRIEGLEEKVQLTLDSIVKLLILIILLRELHVPFCFTNLQL